MSFTGLLSLYTYFSIDLIPNFYFLLNIFRFNYGITVWWRINNFIDFIFSELFYLTVTVHKEFTVFLTFKVCGEHLHFNMLVKLFVRRLYTRLVRWTSIDQFSFPLYIQICLNLCYKYRRNKHFRFWIFVGFIGSCLLSY